MSNGIWRTAQKSAKLSPLKPQRNTSSSSPDPNPPLRRREATASAAAMLSESTPASPPSSPSSLSGAGATALSPADAPILMCSLPSPSPSPSPLLQNQRQQQTLAPCSAMREAPPPPPPGSPRNDGRCKDPDPARLLPATLFPRPPLEEAANRRRAPPADMARPNAVAAAARRPQGKGRQGDARYNAAGTSSAGSRSDRLVEAVKMIGKELDANVVNSDILELAMAKGQLFSWLSYWPEEGYPDGQNPY